VSPRRRAADVGASSFAKHRPAAYKGCVREGLSAIRRHVRPRPLGRRLTQERLESSRIGRVLISALVLVTLLAVAVENLPDSVPRRSLMTVGGPYVTATGLDQNWGVFAPDSRRSVIFLVAKVRYANGSTVAWRLPEAGPVFGAYRDYRWRKWAENLMTIEGDGAMIRRPAAAFVAREMSTSGQRPVRVTLGTRFYELRPPGRRIERGPWGRTDFYRIGFR
jgi:hypothetical protein